MGVGETCFNLGSEWSWQVRAKPWVGGGRGPAATLCPHTVSWWFFFFLSSAAPSVGLALTTPQSRATLSTD